MAMSADKHFNQHGGIPEAMDDHRPDDMPAAKTIVVLVVALLVVCTVITAVIYGRAEKAVGAAHPAEHSMNR